jgi:uncharacterized protein YjcR
MSTAMESEVQPQFLGHMIDALYELRERKRELKGEMDDLEQRMEELEAAITKDLGTQGMTLARGTRASVTVTESEVPTTEDWDQVLSYIKQNDAMHLLERRISVAAWRELQESGELVPGTTPFTKRKLSVRKV